MKTKFVIFLLIFSINAFCQNNLTENSDSIVIKFIGNFEYDYIDLYVNGVFVKEFFLYSNENGITFSDFNLVHENLDSISISLVFYLNKHSLGFRYSPLWGNPNKYSEISFDSPKTYQYKWSKDKGAFLYIQTERCKEFKHQKWVNRPDCYNLRFTQSKELRVGFD
jgi:hypothetical protein